MSEVIAPGVVAGPALIGPRVLQCEARDAEHANPIGAVGRVDRYPTLASSVPQLFEGVGSVDLGIPPLDLWSGVTNHVAVQLKGVPRKLSLRHGRLHKPSWRGKVWQGGRKERVRAVERCEKVKGWSKKQIQPNERMIKAKRKKKQASNH